MNSDTGGCDKCRNATPKGYDVYVAIRYMSALLFHGPSARETALIELPQIGREIHPPVGDQGLKVGDAREIIALLDSASVGDEPGCLLIGPLDRSVGSSSDVLLKVIEEFNPEAVRPVLWASDLGMVSSTIKSRCLARWCPATGDEVGDDSLVQTAYGLVDAVLAKDYARVIELVRDNKDRLAFDLLSAVAHALSQQPEILSGVRHALWERIRGMLRYSLRESKVTQLQTEILACFCGA